MSYYKLWAISRFAQNYIHFNNGRGNAQSQSNYISILLIVKQPNIQTRFINITLTKSKTRIFLPSKRWQKNDFYFIYSSRGWTQALEHDWQAPFHWTISPAPSDFKYCILEDCCRYSKFSNAQLLTLKKKYNKSLRGKQVKFIKARI